MHSSKSIARMIIKKRTYDNRLLFSCSQIQLILFLTLKALEIRRQAIKKLITQNRNRLIDLDAEKKSIELVLIRTSNVFYKTHIERRQMIDTWRFAVKSLNMRDRAIHEAINVGTSNRPH